MMVTILKLHECGQSLGQTLVIKEETKRRQNKVLVVEQPISSSPSWFIAVSTVVLTLTLLLKKELPFYRSFFFHLPIIEGCLFLWHYDPANVVIQNSVRVLIKRSKYPGTIINGDFIIMCEKQLKSKILKTALKKMLHTCFFVSTISINLITTWSKLSIAIFSIYSLINLYPFLW